MSNDILRRTIHPVVKVLDEAKGVVEYIASDESVDSYREVIRADGWRFNRFQKNAPFLNSHRFESIADMLGKVIDYRVTGKRLVETVQWAIDVAENTVAKLGWKMTSAGYLKAVSVGFMPVRTVSAYSQDVASYNAQLDDLGIKADEHAPHTIYLEQEQVELSACVVGANPNAVAKAYKAGALDDADLETICQELAKRETASTATSPADAVLAKRQARQREFLDALNKRINTL